MKPKLFLRFLLASAFLVAGCSARSPVKEKQTAGKQVEDLTLVIGISRILEFSEPIGSIDLPVLVFDYRRVRGKSGDLQQLLLFPKTPGVSDFTVHDSAGKVLRKYSVRVVPSDRAAIDRQKAAESLEGKKVEDLSLTVGVSQTLDFANGIGGIFLTDPALFGYTRVGGRLPEEVKSLLLLPKRAGITDLTVYDFKGNLQKRYFVHVVGK